MKVNRSGLGSLNELPPPAQWRWISRFEPPKTLQISHPRHEKWMASNQQEHPFREIVLCLAGIHFYGFKGKVWKVSPGTVLLIDRGDFHDASYSSYHPNCRDLWIHFFSSSYFTTNDVTISGKKRRPVESQIFYSITHAKPFAETATLAWNHCVENPGSDPHIAQLKASVTAMLLEIILYNTTMSPSQETVAQQEQIVDEIKTYVRNHLEEKLSLNTLAAIAGYDPAYFHRLFARFTGEPIHQFVNRHRIIRAKEMLASGQKATSVANELGFSSHSYFCRFFKRETTQSPSDWLKAKEA